MTLAQLLATIALAQTVVCGWLFVRVRNLSRRLDARSALPPDFVRSLEGRIVRLEARLTREGARDGASPGQGPTSKRQRRLDRRQAASADGPVLIAVPSLASVPVGTSSEVGADKPDPRIFRRALELFAVEPDDAWHVGDDPHKDWGAEAVGLKVFRLERPRHTLRDVLPFVRKA